MAHDLRGFPSSVSIAPREYNVTLVAATVCVISRCHARLMSRPATLHCTISLVPKSQSDAHPVGAGRAPPDPLAEPADRPNPTMILTVRSSIFFCPVASSLPSTYAMGPECSCFDVAPSCRFSGRTLSVLRTPWAI